MLYFITSKSKWFSYQSNANIINENKNNNQSEPITNFKDYYLKKDKVRNLKLTEHIELDSEALGFKGNYVLEGHEDLLLPYDYNLFYNYEIILIEKGNVRKRYKHLNNEKILDSKIVVLKSDEPFDKWNNINYLNF